MKRLALLLAVSLGAAAACDDFTATNSPPDAGVDGSVADAAIVDANEPDANEAAAPVDAGADADPCGACRSHFCDPDGGCYPLAFVTGDVFHGDLDPDGGATGVARAHEICNQVGNAGQTVTGNFRAWLSDQTHTALTTITDVPNTTKTRPVVLVNGSVVASSYLSLAPKTTLLLPIDLTASGGIVTAGQQVWTGTKSDNSPGDHLCSNWTYGGPSDNGHSGVVGTVDMWTASTELPCSNQHHLYCFEVVK